MPTINQLVRKGRKSNHVTKVFDFLNKCGLYLRDIYKLTKKMVGTQDYLNEMDCIFKK